MLRARLLAQGDRAGAAALVRDAWRHDELLRRVEARVLEMFGDISPPPTTRRAWSAASTTTTSTAGLRAAERIGGDDLTIAQARARGHAQGAATPRRCSTRCRQKRAANPATFSRARNGCAQNDKAEEAGKLILTRAA